VKRIIALTAVAAALCAPATSQASTDATVAASPITTDASAAASTLPPPTTPISGPKPTRK